MRKERAYRLLSPIVDVRPDEAFTSLLLFFYFFLLTFPAYIIKPVKNSDLLQALGPEWLPVAYLTTAVLIGFVVALNTKLLQLVNRRRLISFSLIFFILTVLLFWFLFKLEWKWLSLFFWFWSDVFLATSVTQFWMLVNDTFNPHQAKRLISFFVSGGLLGGVTGSFLVSRVAELVGTIDLLLICPVGLLLCLVVVNVVYNLQKKRKEEESEQEKERKQKVGYTRSFKVFLKNRYLIILAGIMASGIVVTTLIDFQFNNVVHLTFPLKDAKTAFFGTFYMVLCLFAYFLHILATNRILKYFGIRAALLIAPSLLLIGALCVVFIPAASLLYWAVFMRGADKSLSHSLNQSVRELLYIPVSPEIKYKAKVFIDMFVNKFARGLAAVIILIFFTFLNFKVIDMSLITVLFILIWLGFNFLITREFVNIVKKELKIKWEDGYRLISDKIDVDMTKLVFDTLHSRERSSVLYAMNLFDLIKREKMTPGLRRIISYKSGEVLASSMDSLFELDGEALVPESDDRLDVKTLTAEVKEIMSLDVYQQLISEHISRVATNASPEAEVSKMEAAKVLGMLRPTSQLIRELKKLLKDDSPEVVRYAVESAGRLKHRELVPLIVPLLSSPATREYASRALQEYGTKITGTLKDYLGDPEEDIRIRRAIPAILSKFENQKAVDILTLELSKNNREVKTEIVEALYRIRASNPEVKFEREPILLETKELIKKSYLTLIELYESETDRKKAFLKPDLERHLARFLKEIFELLSLIYPREDIDRAYQNICAGTRKSIDYSLELLDNMLKREIREYLFPLIDNIPFEDKVKRCRKLLKSLEKARQA